MSMRITCPQCQRQLLLPPDCTAEVLSCPSCRAEIANPQTTAASPLVQTESTPAVESAVTPSPLPTPIAPTPSIREVNVDYPRDNYRPHRWTVFLASLGGLGIAYGLLAGFAALKDRTFLPLLIVLSVLTVFTIFSAVQVSNRHPSNSVSSFLGHTILKVLTVAGVVVGVGLLLSVAAAIILFVVCFSNGGRC